MNRIKHLSVALMLIAMLCIMASCGCEHETVADPAIAATCTTTGLTEGSHCSLCGEVLIAQETIPAIGHTEAINESKDATCTETGLTEGKYCSVCNETLLVQETIPAKGHTEVVKEAKDATCTETGLTEGKDCSVCGAVLIAQETIYALEHSYSKGVCTVCGLPDPTVEKIAKALQNIERYPKTIEINKGLIETSYDLFVLTVDYSYFSDAQMYMLQIVDCLKKVINICESVADDDYWIGLIVEQSQELILEMPLVPLSISTSAVRNYIGKCESFAVKADRIFVHYSSLCDEYGVK